MGRGLKPETLSIDLFPDLIVAYYVECPFSGVDLDQDGDMLLFQYGAWNFNKERYFELDFTRQLYLQGNEEKGHQVYQMSITFFYPEELFQNLASLNKWAMNHCEIDVFCDFVKSSPGFVRASGLRQSKLEIDVDLIC